MVSGRIHSPSENTTHSLKVDDREVRIELGPDRDFAGRIDIVDESRRWTYGVTVDGSVRLKDTFDDGTLVEDSEDPAYLDEILLAVGLHGGRN